MKNIYKNGKPMKNSYSESELWIAVEDATNEITRQLGEHNMLDYPMNKKMVMLRDALAPVMKTKALIHGQIAEIPMKMETFGLRGEDKKTCEAAFEQALIDYKKQRTIAGIPTIAPSDWLKSLHSVSYNIQKSDIGPYILASLKQVWNALLAANIVSGKPYQEILYFESTMQGNGKSTLMKNLYDAARDVGLDAGATTWPSYGYNNLKSLQSNHMTYINDSTMRDRDVDTEAVMAMIRREEVTTREKYKPEVIANAQGAIYAAGNREPYAQGRGWARIRFNTIKAEEAAEYFNHLTKLSRNVIKNKPCIYMALQDFNHLITKITEKINENNIDKKFSNDDYFVKKLKITKSCQHIALIQSLFAEHNNIDLTSISVNQMIKLAKNTSNEIYSQTASNIANDLFNMFKAGLIERKTRQYDLKYCKYDITPIMDIDLDNVETIPDSDFDIIADCEKEWERWEAIFAEFDPKDPNKKENNEDVDTNGTADDISLQQSGAGETSGTEPEAKSNIELCDTGTQEQLEEGEKMTYDILNTMNKLKEDVELPPIEMPEVPDVHNELPKDKNIKIEYTFDDGDVETVIRTRDEFAENELNLIDDGQRPFYRAFIERGYTKECKPNPIGAKTIRMTFTDEDVPNTAPRRAKCNTNVEEYLKLNGNTDAKTPEEIDWDNLLRKYVGKK